MKTFMHNFKSPTKSSTILFYEYVKLHRLEPIINAEYQNSVKIIF